MMLTRSCSRMKRGESLTKPRCFHARAILAQTGFLFDGGSEIGQRLTFGFDQGVIELGRRAGKIEIALKFMTRTAAPHRYYQ